MRSMIWPVNQLTRGTEHVAILRTVLSWPVAGRGQEHIYGSWGASLDGLRNVAGANLTGLVMTPDLGPLLRDLNSPQSWSPVNHWISGGGLTNPGPRLLEFHCCAYIADYDLPGSGYKSPSSVAEPLEFSMECEPSGGVPGPHKHYVSLAYWTGNI